MDWPRPQPESSYLWDQVSQLRCYLYDPTSSHISTSLVLLPSRSLLSRFSFSPFLPPLSLSLSCSFPSFLLSFCSLLCFFVSFPPGSPLPFLRIAAVHVIFSRSLFSLLAGRTFCFSLKVTRPPAARRCFLECQIVVRLYPRNRYCGFVSLRAFDRMPDSTVMMRENHKRLLLSRCTISILMDIKPFASRWKDTPTLMQSNIYITLYRSYIAVIFIISYRNGYKYNNIYKPYNRSKIYI